MARTSAVAAPRSYQAGRPYGKYQERGSRELLLDGNRVQELMSQIVAIVLREGPIHKDLLVDRLKEVNDVERVGTNVQANIDRAIDIGVRGHRLQRISEGFLLIPGAQLQTFRMPGDSVHRPLGLVSAEDRACCPLLG